MRRAWETKEFTITYKRIQEGKHEGSVKMTLWACGQKFRKEHYERVKRLKLLNAPGGATAQVATEVHGQHGAGGLGHNARAEQDRIEGDDRVDHEEFLELAGADLRRFEDSEGAKKRERQAADFFALKELYEPGSWRCSRCRCVNSKDTRNCPHHIRIDHERGKSFKLCRGSQTETFGGYVSKHEQKPALMTRHVDPEWRGKFSSGVKAQRARAKGEITEEEISRWSQGEPQGEGAEGEERTKIVEATMGARSRLKEARNQRTKKK